MKAKLKNVMGQASWRVASDRVEAFVTRTGGHLAPVVFDRRGRKIAPFQVAPWAQEKSGPMPAILKVLRGDFFCMPFGGNATAYRGEQHPIHGETANRDWSLERWEQTPQTSTLHLSMRTRIRRGRVDKIVCLRRGQDVVYQRHVVSGVTGPMSLGHHATLRFPDVEGSGVISTSRFVRGQVFTGQFEKAEEGGYSALKSGAMFRDLSRVPLANGGYTDVSRYPARRGYEDLVQLVSDPKLDLAWTAVTFPGAGAGPRHGYVWFALKDPRVLNGTLLWISNGGRHMAPWSGRHVNVMGLEELTSYFHTGLAESARKNPWRTCLTLRPDRPLVVNYIIGVASIPRGFDRVARITPRKGGVTLYARSGKRAEAAVDVGFLYES